MKKHYLLILLFICSILVGKSQTKASKQTIREILNSEYFEGLYSRTYYSLVDRMQSDGYLPESLTNAYEGMFPRTTGPFALLMMECGRNKDAELNIQYVLDAIKENDMERIPRIIGKDGSKKTIIDDQHQIDGQAHVTLAWARLALLRGHTQFEDDTWIQVRDIMRRTCDRTCFQYGNINEPTRPSLVKNVDFEHSRDARAWDVWDLLTQSFIGASLDDMTKIAERRNDLKQADEWKSKIDLLKEGINKFLVTERDGMPTYVEMLQQTPTGSEPYMGMGWVCYSPIAAGWEGTSKGSHVMYNTVKYMEKTLLKHSNGVVWMPTDGYPNNTFSNEMIGKGIGWEIDFASSIGNYDRIAQIFDMIKIVNNDHKLYMEGAWLDGHGYWQNQHLTDADLNNMKQCVWKVKDAGNGEQTAWWCWAMARLRKSVGLSAEPARTIVR